MASKSNISKKKQTYNDFLAEEIRLGLEDIEAGRVCTLEELKREMQELIERKKIELAEKAQKLH